MKVLPIFTFWFLLLQHFIVAAQIKSDSDSLRTVYLQEKNDSVRTEKQFLYIGNLLRKDKNFASLVPLMLRNFGEQAERKRSNAC